MRGETLLSLRFGLGIHLVSSVIPAVGELAPAVVGRGGDPSSPFRHPRGRWRGSIRIEEQMDSRHKHAGMTNKKMPGMTKMDGNDGEAGMLEQA